MLPTDLAYAAGIIDGEGTIQITKRPVRGKRRNPAFDLEVTVAMTDAVIIDWLKALFGGCRCISRLRNLRFRPVHRWSVSNAQAEATIQLLLPYLKIKHPQAQVGMKLRVTVTRYRHLCRRLGLPPEATKEREVLHSQMRALNQKGNGRKQCVQPYL